MDCLTEVLDSLRIRSLVTGLCTLGAPWGLRVPKSFDEFPDSPPPKPPVAREMRPAHHPGGPPAGFYAVSRGRCWLEIDGRPEPIRLETGDLALFPANVGRQIRDDLRSVVRPVWETVRVEDFRERNPITAGGTGSTTDIVIGLMLLERDHPLMKVLPSVILLKKNDVAECGPLKEILGLLSEPSRLHGPGSQAVVNGLVQALFSQAVRTHLLHQTADREGWLRALFDEQIGPAVQSIHFAPDARWTVATLGEQAAMSRSAFAARFMQIVGEPPMQYLTRMRMDKAAELLRSGHTAIKTIAAQVGYESEAAFSSAFKRTFGSAPGTYRREFERPTIAKGHASHVKTPADLLEIPVPVDAVQYPGR